MEDKTAEPSAVEQTSKATDVSSEGLETSQKADESTTVAVAAEDPQGGVEGAETSNTQTKEEAPTEESTGEGRSETTATMTTNAEESVKQGPPSATTEVDETRDMQGLPVEPPEQQETEESLNA